MYIGFGTVCSSGIHWDFGTHPSPLWYFRFLGWHLRSLEVTKPVLTIRKKLNKLKISSVSYRFIRELRLQGKPLPPKWGQTG